MIRFILLCGALVACSDPDFDQDAAGCEEGYIAAENSYNGANNSGLALWCSVGLIEGADEDPYWRAFNRCYGELIPTESAICPGESSVRPPWRS